MVFTGLFFSLANGAIQPTYGIVIGKIVQMFDPAIPDEKKSEMMLDFIATIVALSFASYITSYAAYALM